MDTLLLSHAYETVDRISWQRAVILFFNGKVEIIETYEEELRSPSTCMRRSRRGHAPSATADRAINDPSSSQKSSGAVTSGAATSSDRRAAHRPGYRPRRIGPRSPGTRRSVPTPRGSRLHAASWRAKSTVFIAHQSLMPKIYQLQDAAGRPMFLQLNAGLQEMPAESAGVQSCGRASFFRGLRELR